MEKPILPLAVADVMVDEILEASDEEILEMAREEAENVEVMVSEMRATIKYAVDKAKLHRRLKEKE